MPQVLMDTDVLSNLMRGHPVVVARAEAYLSAHGRLTLSILTRYEILRGLKAKGATTQRAAFDRLCNASLVLPLTDGIIVKAAEIYADLYRRGAIIGDVDILIAATALMHTSVKHQQRASF